MFPRKRHQMRHLCDLACLLAKQVLREFRTQPILIRLNAKESFNAKVRAGDRFRGAAGSVAVGVSHPSATESNLNY
jgi:hypothetical protein